MLSLSHSLVSKQTIPWVRTWWFVWFLSSSWFVSNIAGKTMRIPCMKLNRKLTCSLCERWPTGGFYLNSFRNSIDLIILPSSNSMNDRDMHTTSSYLGEQIIEAEETLPLLWSLADSSVTDITFLDRWMSIKAWLSAPGGAVCVTYRRGPSISLNLCLVYDKRFHLDQ